MRDLARHASGLGHAAGDMLDAAAIKNKIYGRFSETFMSLAGLLAGLCAVPGIGIYAPLQRINRSTSAL